MASKKTSIYLTDEIRAKLRLPPYVEGERVEISAAISEIAERYDAIVTPEKRRLEALFTEGEWNAMRNACNGTAWTADAIRGGVLANTQDSLDDELKGYGANRVKLEAKLASLSIAAQYALVEMIEAWWADK